MAGSASTIGIYRLHLAFGDNSETPVALRKTRRVNSGYLAGPSAPYSTQIGAGVWITLRL